MHSIHASSPNVAMHSLRFLYFVLTVSVSHAKRVSVSMDFFHLHFNHFSLSRSEWRKKQRCYSCRAIGCRLSWTKHRDGERSERKQWRNVRMPNDENTGRVLAAFRFHSTSFLFNFLSHNFQIAWHSAHENTIRKQRSAVRFCTNASHPFTSLWMSQKMWSSFLWGEK